MFKDPRTPVSVEQIGKFKVSIYNLEAYEQSQLDYPDDPSSLPTRVNNDKPLFAKKKSASRYNWIVPIEQPLGKVAQEKGQTA
ncbi:MAG TPA: hypothetical protein VHV10_20695 [Ktedonobacteraceae bacterium]|jgi:hypothetical protein|nr:hypothetical protein [Ktedonobacteraceae bacterium]